MRRALAAWTVVVVLAAAACSGKSSPASQGGDDGGSDASSEGSPVQGDSSSPAAETGICGDPATGACNALTNLGVVVVPSCSDAAAPTMTGGLIASGTWVLTSAVEYGVDCGGVAIPSRGPTTLQVSGGCMQSIDANGGAQTYTVATDGSTLDIDQVCPALLTGQLFYTATDTTWSQLSRLGGGITVVSVFTKR